MGEKRLLMLGVVLVAAGIGTPVTAMLTRGAEPEPRTPAAEATIPAAPEAPYLPVEMTPPLVVESGPAPTSAPRRVGADPEVPSHLGHEPPPGRPRGTADPTATSAPAAPPAAPAPATEATDPRTGEPTLLPAEPGPGDDAPAVEPPPALPDDDRDPADE
jgi:hypothetical protein